MNHGRTLWLALTVSGTWMTAPESTAAPAPAETDSAVARAGVEQVPLHIAEQAEAEQQPDPPVDAVGGAVAHHEVEGNGGDAVDA